MSARYLDLASRPFANVRPLRRAAFVLWVAGAALTVANVSLYLKSFKGLESTQLALAEATTEIATLDEEIKATTASLRSMDLLDQNARARFLNLRIAERTFGWGLLFDRLGEVMPREVRLASLSPQVTGDSTGTTPTTARSRRRPRIESRAGEVFLRITGTSEGDQPLYDFLDRLYADPAFANPSLAREDRDLGQLRRFTMSVSFLPEAAAGSEPLPGAEGELAAGDSELEGGQIATHEGGAVDPHTGLTQSQSGSLDGAITSAVTPDGGTDASPRDRTVTDRTGQGRYLGADDPRGQGTRSSPQRRATTRVPIRSSRSADTAPRDTGGTAGGLQYIGGTNPDGSATTGGQRGASPVAVGSTASDTGRPQ